MSELEFWKDLGNIFEAVMNYQKKNVEFNSRFINPWIRLGNIFERQDQANDAVQAYQRATEIDPDTTQNWVELGDAQFKNGEYDQAIEAYRKAVILDPEAGWPLGNLALSMVTQGRIEEAIPLYKKSIDLLTEVKDKAICWNRLGNAYRKLNNYEDAFHAFQKADQLDGDNTGFSDKLDATPPHTSVVAPEEILEQMIVDRASEEDETEVATDEAMSESIEETIAQVETADKLIALAPNMEIKIEESIEEEIAQSLDETIVEEEAAQPLSEAIVEEAVAQPLSETVVEEEAVAQPLNETAIEEDAAQPLNETLAEEEAAQPLNETVIEEPSNENALVEEEAPLVLQEKKFDFIQMVEDVIAKVEQAYAEQKSCAASEEQVVEEIPAEAKLLEVSEELAQEVEVVATISEEAAQDVEPVMETNEEVAPEVESPVMSEEVSLEAEAPIVSEEASPEVISEAAEINEKTESEVESPVASKVNEEEQVSEDAPRRIPAWLVVKSEVKAEEKVIVIESEATQELAQVESVTTLSDISQEAAVSESVVNMDVVETYTDPLAVQLTTEPNLSEEAAHSEAADQVESYVEHAIETEAQAIAAVDESNAVEESAIAEESSAVVVAEKQTIEMAYEEYLKDAVEPASLLKDHVDDIQREVPVTKVSKNGEVRIAMDTKNAHVWNELGNIYLNAGTCDDAIASYSKAIELDRQFAWPYSNLALAYVQKGRFAEAILLYQRGIELFTLDRDKAITWNRLGNVYRRINDYSNAIASYQTADELDPENATLSLRSSFGLLGNMYSDSKPAYVG